MKWKTFWQIVLLMIIAGAIVYIASPKYYFGLRDTVVRCNKITGKVMGFTTGIEDGKQVKPRGWKLLK